MKTKKATKINLQARRVFTFKRNVLSAGLVTSDTCPPTTDTTTYTPTTGTGIII